MVMWTSMRPEILTQRQESVFGVHESQHSPQQIFVHDVHLDVVCVVLHAEGQQLQNQSQKLSGLKVI